MTKRIVILSDTQLPYHARKEVKALIRFIGEYQPDELVHIGDMMDFPQPSRWTAGTRGEFAKSIFEDCHYAKLNLLQAIRDVYDGPFGVHRGNHDSRPEEYLERQAPALSGHISATAYNFEVLLDFDGFGIDVLPEFNEIAPGWISTHGHRGGINLSPIAGNTAKNAAMKFQKSVVMGHTHRLGIGNQTYGYGGNARTVTGMEVGNLMNMKLAGYLKGGTANWQQGFGILTVDGQHVKPEIVPIQKGRFTVDGSTWEV